METRPQISWGEITNLRKIFNEEHTILTTFPQWVIYVGSQM